MLKSLSIRNYALISKLEIDFPKNFSVITGETGSGKSVIIGALSLILGIRADKNIIKQGENKCIIEGVFDLSSYKFQSFFDEKNLEYDAYNCILRREIWDSGKSRAFINDTPVGLNDLRELGVYLIDIHSQYKNLLLRNNNFQLNVLDTLANNKSLKNEYKSVYSSFLSICHQLKELKEKSKKYTNEQDYLLFQFKQLEEANLKSDEQEKLQKESETLLHIEEIKTGLCSIEQLLLDDDKGIVISLKESLNIVLSLKKVYPTLNKIVDRMQTTYLDLKDIAMDISHSQEHLELSPERLQQINKRLDLLYSLQQKHKVNTVDELIELKDRLNKQLEEIANYDENIKNLQSQMEELHANVTQLVQKLTQTRRKTAILLETQLRKQACNLGMPEMRFRCQITNKNPDAFGADDVNFLFSANQNSDLKIISQIASGGEISRLMLGLKALIAEKVTLPTIVFDEIDSGVSGEIADKIGKIMHQMGKVMQVIAITHLPQIAAQGDNQFRVYKQKKESFTEIFTRQLSKEERIKEIAQLLSGSELTNAAIENARELLK